MYSSLSKTVVLPRILTKWPWVRRLSEHYEVSKDESLAWIESFHPFERRGLEAFRKCNFSLLASLTYSPREKPIVRLGSDLMQLFFAVDEYTDIEDRHGVERIRQRLKHVFEHPHSSTIHHDDCLSEIARDFWLRARALVPEDASCIRHFSEAWDAYTSAVVQEADDRAHQRYRSFEDYIQLRRYSGAVDASSALTEFGLNLPDEVYHHPVLISLRETAGRVLVLINDIYSYIMEASRGLAIHNAVEVVMHERKVSTQAAMDWLGKYCDELAEKFLHDLGTLPSWGHEVDSRVSVYIDGLGQWVRGLDDWHFENPRYFGSEAATVKHTRIATLIPPSRGYLTQRLPGPTKDITYEPLSSKL